MNIKIAENIKRLRCERNLTQRQLAKEFNINHQTISKWENGEHIPDVSMLPVIADFFGVTIDELFYDKKVKRYQYEQVVKEQYIEYINRHLDKEARALIEEAYARDRNNHFFMSKYIRYRALDCNSADMDELVRLSNKIAADCSDSAVINDVTSDMIKYYSNIGLSERATNIAENQPSIWRCSEYLAGIVAKGEQIRVRFGRLLYEFIRVAFIMSMRLDDILKPSEIIENHERFVLLLKALVPNGRYSEFNGLICRSYVYCAKASFQMLKYDMGYEYLEKSMEHYVSYFSDDRHYFPSDLWFGALDFGLYATDNIVKTIYKEEFADMPQLQEDKRFVEILSKAKDVG